MPRVENRGNGAWKITLFDGYRPNGTQQRIYRTFHAKPGTTKSSQRRQAERYAGRLQAELDDKRINDAKKVTFKKVYEDYIQDRIVRRKLARQTADSYKSLFERRLLPEFSKKPIRDISTADINRFLRKLAKDRIPRGKQEKNKKAGRTRTKAARKSCPAPTV